MGFLKILPKDFIYLVAIFLVWRFALIAVVVLSIHFFPIHSPDRYLGGGVRNYLILPQFFAWGNFDGEHYLSIAISGYKYLEQAFFPLYPLVVGFLNSQSAPFFFKLIPNESIYLSFSGTLWGLMISNLSFLLALLILWEMVRDELGEKVAYLTISTLLVFPTSFFFGAMYTESTFLLFLVVSFYFARKSRWVLASIFGILASATRVFGILILPTLIIFVYQKKIKLIKSFWITFIPAGIVIYMYFLWTRFNDPLAFYHLQTIIGQQHQSGIILLPQVYLRYVRMLSQVSFSNPIYQTLVLEFFTGIIFFLLPFYGFFKKVRLDYLFFSLTGFLLPTIQGSFSSSPRYVLVLFPSFICIALLIKDWPKLLSGLLLFLLAVCLVIETSLFSLGFWIA